VGDFYWSILAIANSCLSFGCLGCYEGVSVELSFFSFLNDICSTAKHVVCLTFVCWILMGRLLCFEIGSWILTTLFVWLATMFLLWTGGKGCPSDLVLKSGGPITFDSRSGVSSLVPIWVWVSLVSVDRRLRGGGS